MGTRRLTHWQWRRCSQHRAAPHGLLCDSPALLDRRRLVRAQLGAHSFHPNDTPEHHGVLWLLR